MNLDAAISVEAIFISPGHNFFGHHGQPAGVHEVVAVESVECVPGMGLKGDRFFGYKEDYKGQVTFFAAEVYEALCGELGVQDRGPSVFRRNVLTRGIDLTTLIGKEFELQGVVFSGTGESSPCHWMDGAFGPGAEAALKGRGGLRARIVSGGWLRRNV